MTSSIQRLLLITTAREEGAIYWPMKPVLHIPVQDSETHEPCDGEDVLSLLCDKLEQEAASPCEEKYVADLRDSLNAVESAQQQPRIMTEHLEGDLGGVLRNNLQACVRHVHDTITVLTKIVQRDHEIGCAINHQPRTCPTFWLQQLHKDRYDLLPPQWRNCIVAFGLAITEVHRARRLFNAFENNPSSLALELAHEGHQNWDPAEFPETLLLEVEGGFLVRDVQEDIAKHMRDLPAGHNAVLQLNCGEGKSSVIVPMVAAALSDKTK